MMASLLPNDQNGILLHQLLNFVLFETFFALAFTSHLKTMCTDPVKGIHQRDRVILIIFIFRGLLRRVINIAKRRSIRLILLSCFRDPHRRLNTPSRAGTTAKWNSHLQVHKVCLSPTSKTCQISIPGVRASNPKGHIIARVIG